ncbi:NlpC/P60 family protein [Streptacidiphilus sp. PB12-B1b]|uniref:C40 family peptidase n=1 Tax=Streptacidiphilus sp. PB12-B1b TaxID=2705012 RepID=UPI0015FCB00A|nr:C40 family peptidase [Streptacidiphilus sp. PB12-B1b]QMU79263.1 NlpC/P60 family protein [Streptacidiphilus sp. PB12-B1b]
MASHRKPPPALRSGTATRTAVTLVTAAAASATVLVHAAQADPQTSVADVTAQVGALYQQAEVATQNYDGAVAETTALQGRVGRLEQQAAGTSAAMNAVLTRLGAAAAAQYRDGGTPAVLQLLTSAHPDQFLQLAGSIDQAAGAEQQLLDQYGAQEQTLHRQQAATETELRALRAEQQSLSAAKAQVQAKLAHAQQLLDTLTAAQRDSWQQSGAWGGLQPPPGLQSLPVTGPAAAAVAFAEAQVGKPYVWGATGPGAYDCSGLTQAAWAAAGVSLPRTTYQQIDAGQRIPVNQLRPGDLVFYFSGVSHVGMYVGDGEIVHAPHPGARVEYAPVGEMPIVGAVRPD